MTMKKKLYNINNISVYVNDKRWYRFRQLVQKIAYEILKYKQNFVCITLSNDNEIIHLNNEYRNKNYATDIISIPMEIQLNGAICLGDIILSYDSIKEKSQIQKVTIKQYTKMIITHGILHLLGYNHETEEEWTIMENVEYHLSEKFKNL